MVKKEDKLSKRRFRSSFVTTVVSLSMVLFILGLVGLLLLFSKEVSNYVKENIGFSIFVKDDIKEVDLIRLKKNLDASRYVKSTEEISKEKAAKDLKEEIGEDFMEFLGYNPLPVSINVRMHAEYANPDSIAMINKELAQYTEIEEFFYHSNLIEIVNSKINTISLILLVISGFLFIIAFTLINNTIRLAVYSKRFTIKTMQLVGATRGFIRRPFLYMGLLQGFLGAVVAIVFITALLSFIQENTEGVIGFSNQYIIIILYAIVIVTGIIITCISTYFAVNKYLRIKTDSLYH